MLKSPDLHEIRTVPPLMFVPETDAFGRNIDIDKAQMRIDNKHDWSTLLTLRESSGTSLCLVRPDDTEQIVHGEAWFIYGDSDTGLFYISNTSGKFDLPKQTLMIGAKISSSILSYKPEKKSDYKLDGEKSLQPLALVTKDGFGQLSIFRKYNEKIDMPTNTISFSPSKFEITSPNVEISKNAAAIIAEWQTDKKSELFRTRTLGEIKDLARIATLRLAHKNKSMPPELTPDCKYDKESSLYNVTMYVSEHGKSKIVGDNSDTDTDTNEKQLGDDYGFGSKLIFSKEQDRGQEINGSILLNSYDNDKERSNVVLVDDLHIKPTDKKLSTELLKDRAGSQVYEVTFSSNRPDNIINVLIGIDRGLKPRYMPEGELGAT